MILGKNKYDFSSGFIFRMNLPFPLSEYKVRLANVQTEMSKSGFDVLVLTKPENIYYISGNRASYVGARLTSLHALVVPRNGDPVLICRKLEEEAVREQWTSPLLYLDHEDPFNLLGLAISDFKASEGTIGIEEKSVIKTSYDRIKQALSHAKLVNVSGLVDKIRLTMNPKEIEYTQKAAEITEKGFLRGIDVVREGVPYYELVGEIENAMYKAGQTEQESSWVSVWGGPEGGGMHDTFLGRKASTGDLITIEVHGIYNHYRSAAQGTVYVGSGVSPRIKELYGMISEMQEACRSTIAVGVTFEDMYEAANKPYKNAMGTDYFRRVGGTLGLSLFDISAVRGEKSKIQEGYSILIQPLTIKPLITVSSSVLVTKEGLRELNGPLQELIQK
jgi:Xaa-Pro dipeptidase